MPEAEEKVYLRPLGFLDAGVAQPLIDSEVALPLAGGPSAFTLLEIIRRTAEGQIMRRYVRVNDLHSLSRLVGAESVLRLTQARAPIVSIDFSAPVLMGVLNVTPDSFSGDGRFSCVDEAVEAAVQKAVEGAGIIDVGGESTRPGAKAVPADEEIDRVIPVIKALKETQIPCLLSVDSRKAAVMAAALDAGVQIVNDVSALTFDQAGLALIAQRQAHVVLMHARGDPETMQDDPVYGDPLLDIYDFLEERIQACEQAGIGREKIIVDPGIGFGKSIEHNLALLRGLSLFHSLGCPVLLGASRKSFIGALDKGAQVDDRLAGSLAAMQAGLRQGVQLFRVHDVKEARQALRVSQAIAGPALCY